ncbi:hypothetical protein C3747_59g218 [Trypanosoma cruzi]|uniref:Uncharacterized protein n=1 Tax=Trypanosoma cruzi TaxID=5693 RepID=A0A2V2WY64_TRYCR|nr:hypothetical protein C3747_59g218 [Trypanosoma cruzi]
MMAGAATTSYILCARATGKTIFLCYQAGRGKLPLPLRLRPPLLTQHCRVTHPSNGESRLRRCKQSLGVMISTARPIRCWGVGDALLSTTPRVCPPATAVPSTALLSTLIPGPSTTTTTAAYSGSHRRYTGDVVYFCYLWSSGNRITYTGSLTFAARLPSEMTATTPLSDGFRAGVPITLNFTSNTSALQPENDELFFYRFKLRSRQAAIVTAVPSVRPERLFRTQLSR